MTFTSEVRRKWREATPSADEWGAFVGSVTWMACALACLAGLVLAVAGVIDLIIRVAS